MSIDADDAEQLVRSTIKAFTKGLRRLIESAEARVQERLDLLLADLDQEREHLGKERARVERLCESLERERSERSSSGEERSGAARLRRGVRVIRFADEVGAKLSSTAEEKVVECARAMDFLGEQQGAAEEQSDHGLNAKDFLASTPITFGPRGSLMPASSSCDSMTLDIGHRSYAVLPPAHPHTALPSGDDLKNLVIAVPSGWDVLSTSVDGFDAAIRGLTACGWGTPLLIVQHGGGFNTYRTPLSKTGEPGSLYKENSSHLLQISGGSPRSPGGREFRYLYSNGRLVIYKAQADAAAGSRSTSGGRASGAEACGEPAQKS